MILVGVAGREQRGQAVAGSTVRFRTKKPSSRNWRACSDVIRRVETAMFATPVIVDDYIICGYDDSRLLVGPRVLIVSCDD